MIVGIDDLIHRRSTPGSPDLWPEPECPRQESVRQGQDRVSLPLCLTLSQEAAVVLTSISPSLGAALKGLMGEEVSRSLSIEAACLPALSPGLRGTVLLDYVQRLDATQSSLANLEAVIGDDTELAARVLLSCYLGRPVELFEVAAELSNAARAATTLAILVLLGALFW